MSLNLHYLPFYSYRLGRKVITVNNSLYLNKYLAEDPDPPPPDPDPGPPPPPPEPPDEDPLPPPDDDYPTPIPEPEPDPLPPPPDPDPGPPPPPDTIRWPSALVLARSAETVQSHKGLYWLRVTEDLLGEWGIESVEHLRVTLLDKIEPFHACVAFDLQLQSEFYPLTKAFVIRYGGVVYE